MNFPAASCGEVPQKEGKMRSVFISPLKSYIFEENS